MIEDMLHAMPKWERTSEEYGVVEEAEKIVRSEA